MSTQIMPAFFTTTNTRVRKAITGKPRTTATIKHEKFIKSFTKGHKSSQQLKNEEFKRQYRENMKVEANTCTNGFGDSESCIKRGVMTNMFKEKPEVQKEIMAKAARTAPLFNKGGYQYVTDGQDKTDLGRKK